MPPIPPTLRFAAARLGLDQVLADPPPPHVDLTVTFRGRAGEARVTVQPGGHEVAERGWFEPAPSIAGRGATAHLRRAGGGRVVDIDIRIDGCGGEMALDAARALCTAGYA